jgi:hypothetical protein
VKVTKQVVVSFSIAKYADKVTSCWGDHGPWQYDRKAIHDGVKNRCTIVKDGKIITHVPLTPKQVYDDQIKLKREHEAMGREDQGEEQGEREDHHIRLEPKPLQPLRAPIQNTNKYSANTPNKSDHSTTTQKHPI